MASPKAMVMRIASLLLLVLLAACQGERAPETCLSDSDIQYWRPRTLGDALFNWWD